MKNPFRNKIHRPKHPNLFLTGYLAALFIFSLCISLAAGNAWGSWADTEGSWWRAVVSTLMSLAAGMVCGWWAYERWRSMHNRLFELDIEFGKKPSDEGEFLEYGPGWRKFRWDLFITHGTGRLAQHSLEWVAVAIKLDEKGRPPIIIDASSPDFYMETSEMMIDSWKGQSKWS